MKKNIKGRCNILLCIIPVFILSSLLSSCEKFVEVDLPISQMSNNLVFNNVNTANSALANLYISIRDKGFLTGNPSGASFNLGYYSDELIAYGTDAFYQNNLLAETNVSGIWNDSYNIIYSANAVLEGLEASSTLSSPDKAKFSGEALFIRAFVHFYLINVFGEIPYLTSTDYTKNMKMAKASIQDCYKAVINDLLQAKSNLPEAYISDERARVNRSVANALLARVYLYNENWEAAHNHADEVIRKTELYKWVDNVDQVFLNNSTGTIWQLVPRAAGMNTYEANNFIFVSGPPTNRSLNPSLLDAMEHGDLRRIKWVGTVIKDSDKWYFPYKYKENKSTPVSKEYSILFRLEEMYLIRAEASAHLDLLKDAASDLDKIRNRAGLNNTLENNKPGLLEAIIKERRIEFFSEFGHRFFDLKRTGQLNTVLGSVKPGWDTTDELWPLPENELKLNPNLKPQNPGY